MPVGPETQVEVCVETIDAALSAGNGGADRIELCANLAAQGTTPPDDVLAACTAALAIPVFSMVRSRTGTFTYGSDEIATMIREVRRARALGARGVVIGALRLDRTVDRDAVAALRREAAPLPVTFHRAFDATRDRAEALETLIALGVDRVLTSGGAATALEGVEQIARLVRQAAGRMRIMAGGSVRAHNVREIVAHSGVRDVHARLVTAEEVRGLVEAVREGMCGRDV